MGVNDFGPCVKITQRRGPCLPASKKGLTLPQMREKSVLFNWIQSSSMR